MVFTRRLATVDEIERIINRMAEALFDERILSVPLRYRGLGYQGQTLYERERVLFLHLVQRVVAEEQWANGIGEQEYLADVRAAIRDPTAQLCVYWRRGGSLAAIFVPNGLPPSHRGSRALPYIIVVYSADRGRIVSGYQVSN
jgi:hypothetical protein